MSSFVFKYSGHILLVRLWPTVIATPRSVLSPTYWRCPPLGKSSLLIQLDVGKRKLVDYVSIKLELLQCSTKYDH